MGFVRPISDIASFPAAEWQVAPLFSKVNDVQPDDSVFITAPVVNSEDPQVALGLADLEIPYGAQGRIEVRVRMRWSADLTVAPLRVRIGLADVADLGVDQPTLLFERSLSGSEIFDFSTDTLLEFQEFEVIFDYDDFAGDAAAFGVYVEMTPDPADTTQQGQVSWVEVMSCIPAVITNACNLGGLTAGAVISEARDHHPAFNPRQHPNGTLLRLLSSYQRKITSEIARVNAPLCASQIIISLPLADFDAGVKLPANTYVLPGVLLRTAGMTDLKEPIDLVDATLRGELDMAHKFAYLRGNNLFLGRRASNYANFDQLIVELVLVPRRLERLTDVLLLPDWGEDTYVAEMVKKLSTRSEMAGNVLLDADQMQRDFLATVAQQKAAQASGTLDVWPA
jgi:hypothetical protein